MHGAALAPPGPPAHVPDGAAQTALVLGGGGARAAYQVGVLRSLARIRREMLGQGWREGNPFGVICGSSAGAINAAALASLSDRFDAGVEALARIWSHFSADQVYRADSLGMVRSGTQWLTMLSLGWALARWGRAKPRSLLDNQPLAELLHRVVPLHRLPGLLEHGHLRALAVTASSYSNGEHHTFYAMHQPVAPWLRSQRVAVPCVVRHEHLLASSAIPFVFPAQRLSVSGQEGWFGDGSMRQTAPLSPAIHLGAKRLLVVGAGRLHEPGGRAVANHSYPSLAQVAGHALSSIFLDALTVDIERAQRINRTLAMLPPEAMAHTPLRPLEVLVISPSVRLDDLAAEHLGSLPRAVRALLRGAGVSGRGQAASGSALASYLLFEAPFTQALMALGERDAMARRIEVQAFFGWERRTRPRQGEPAGEGGRVPEGQLSVRS